MVTFDRFLTISIQLTFQKCLKNEFKNNRKAVKGTALLFLLFGVPNLIFSFNARDTGGFEAAYILINSTLVSFQVRY